MKKLLFVLLAMVMFIPFAKADVTGPEPRTYDAVVVAEDGMKYYDYTDEELKKPLGTIPKGETILVDFEYNTDGETLISFSYKKIYGVARVKDVMNTEFVDPKSDDISELYDTMYLLTTKDVDVKKGPGTGYETIGTLKKNEKVEVLYYVDEPLFIYVENNNVKGWVSVREDSVKLGGYDAVVYKDYESECGTVKANEVLKDVWQIGVYGEREVKYQSCTLDTNMMNVVYMLHTKKYYKLNEDAKMYAKAGDKDPVKEIKSGSEILVLSDYVWENEANNNQYVFYVEYEGVKGWVGVSDSELSLTYVKDFVEPAKKDDKKETKNSKDIVLTCVIIAIAVAAAALIIIIIVNKNKKKEVTPQPVQ